jgi:hypothetical protein
MRKSALFVTTCTCVSIIRALKHVALSALGALLAIANGCKRPANGRGRADSNVSIATIRICAVATKKVGASRDTMRDGFMGEIASITSSAPTVAEIVFADGDLVGIMRVAAAIAEGAHACEYKSVYNCK